MRPALIYFFLLCSSPLFSQHTFYSESLTKIGRENQDSGSKIVAIPVYFKTTDSACLTNGVTFSVKIEEISRNLRAPELKTASLQYDATDLQSGDSILAEIPLEVFHSVRLEKDLYKLSLTATQDPNLQHALYVEIFTKQATMDELLNRTQRFEIGQLELADAYGPIDIYERDTSSNNKKPHDQMNLRDKRFHKLYTNKCLNSEEKSLIPDNVHIEKVSIQISEGRIHFLYVKLNGVEGVFRNEGPISLTNMYNRRYHELRYDGSNKELKGTFLALGDVIRYLPVADRTYYPTKVSVELTPKEPAKTIYSESSPHTFIEGRLFTDLAGLSGNENGLVQTELNGRWILSSNPILRTHFTPFQYVRAGISWSKFDSAYDTLEVASRESTRARTLLPLNQQAFSNFYVDFDLLGYSRVSDAYLRIGHNLALTRVQFSDDSSFQRVFTPSLYLKFGGSIVNTPWLKIDFNMPVHFIYLYDDMIVQDIKRYYCMMAPEIELSMKLRREDELKEKEGSSVFARIRYYDLLDRGGSNFWQIQTGVEIPISNFLKGL